MNLSNDTQAGQIFSRKTFLLIFSTIYLNNSIGALYIVQDTDLKLGKVPRPRLLAKNYIYLGADPDNSSMI